MNAIILAAGMGTRISRLSKDFHKALLQVKGRVNIERTIEYLREFGVDEINIVTGHNAHLFDYLKDKYSINLIYNKHYKDYNNMYSFYMASGYFGDTIVIDADAVFLENIFVKRDYSFYYTVVRPKSNDKEWAPIVDDNGKVIGIDVTNEEKPSLFGASYWTKEDAMKIKEKLSVCAKDKELMSNGKLYWDDIPRKLFSKLNVKIHIVHSELVSEIDTEQDYNKVK